MNADKGIQKTPYPRPSAAIGSARQLAQSLGGYNLSLPSVIKQALTEK
jgi:hypothetical protein